MKLIQITQIEWTEETNSEEVMLPPEDIMQISGRQWNRLKDDPHGDILKRLLGFMYDGEVISLRWQEFYPTDVRDVSMKHLDY